MGEDWVKLLNSTDRFEVDLLIAMLDSNGVKAVKLNQQDSAYLSIGSIDLYVHRDDIIKAKYLIKSDEE